MSTKLTRTLASFTLVAGLLAAAAPVFAQGGGSFSLRPDPSVTTSINGGYFEYALQPGAVVDDAVLLVNTGSEPVDLVLYAADARTADNGGLAFPGGATDAPQRAGAWLSLTADTVSLQPGETRTVPFTFAVPDGVAGEFAAGIVAQPAAGATADAQGSQFAVAILQRAAVTVVAAVQSDAPLAPKMEIAALAAEVNGERQLVNATLRNSGQVGLRPQGMLTVTDDADTIVRAVPVELGYFLAGDEIGYRIGIEPPLPTGDFNVTFELTYDGGQAAHTARLALTEPNFEGEVVEFDAPVTAQRPASAGVSIEVWALVGAMLLLASLVLLQTARLALSSGRPKHRPTPRRRR